jgi:hypothetical protein
MKRSILFCGLLIIVAVQALQAQTSYTWTGASSTSWNTATNWAPNGIPGAADNVTIVTGGNTCKLGAGTSITNLTVTSGTLDMNGGTLTVSGTIAQFTAGTVQNGTLTVTGATTTTFGNGPVTMNCVVNITSAAFTAKNTTFQNTTTITKTGATNDASAGGNIFNGTLNATNNGSGWLMFGNGNGDQFNAAATFINTGSSSIYVAYSGTASTFNGVTTFTNSPSNNNGIYVSWNTTGTAFNNNIVVNSTAGTGLFDHSRCHRIFSGYAAAASVHAVGCDRPKPFPDCSGRNANRAFFGIQWQLYGHNSNALAERRYVQRLDKSDQNR